MKLPVKKCRENILFLILIFPIFFSSCDTGTNNANDKKIIPVSIEIVDILWHDDHHFNVRVKLKNTSNERVIISSVDNTNLFPRLIINGEIAADIENFMPTQDSYPLEVTIISPESSYEFIINGISSYGKISLLGSSYIINKYNSSISLIIIYESSITVDTVDGFGSQFNGEIWIGSIESDPISFNL
jgi:hypothetical protein